MCVSCLNNAILYVEVYIFLKAYEMWGQCEHCQNYITDNSASNVTSFKDLEVFEPEPQVPKRQVYILQTLNHVSFIGQYEKVKPVPL